DVVASITQQSNSPGGSPRVNVVVTPDGRLQITDGGSGSGNLTIAALNGSPAVNDLGLLLSAGATAPDSSTIRGVQFVDSNQPLSQLSLKGSAGPASVGVRRSPQDVDVLVIGGSQGVYRTFNPVGDPSRFGTYPSLPGPSALVRFPGDNNDL